MGYKEDFDVSDNLIENNILTRPQFAIRGNLRFESVLMRNYRDAIGEIP